MASVTPLGSSYFLITKPQRFSLSTKADKQEQVDKMATASFSVPSLACALRSTFFGEDNGLKAARARPAIAIVTLPSVRPIIECKESRIGKKPVPVPANVNITLEGQHIRVNGALGELSQTYPNEIKVDWDASGCLKISKAVETRRANQMHGLFRTLTDNMVVGVSKGFEKKLQLVGVGYRATVEGNDLVMNLGFSHPVRLTVPDGIKVTVEGNTNITVSGRDKCAIGLFAADIRKWRPPEPYKGKGIKYADEIVRRKEGKAGKKK